MTEPAVAANAPGFKRDPRLLAAIAALGLAGVASLMLAPLEQALPPGISAPRWLLLVQPAILVLIMAWLGWITAPRSAVAAPVLGAILARGDWQAPLLRALRPATWCAIMIALVLLLYGYLTADVFAGIKTPAIPLVSKLAYGGMSEEIMLRWGMLGGLLALGLRLGISRVSAFWAANAITALLFGIGHFGLLFSLFGSPPMWLLAAVLVGNALPALGLGYVMRGWGIEAAMLAHAGGHALNLAVLALP